MTEEQINICKLLGGVTYLPGSWDKRFAKSVAGIAEYSPEKELTEHQNEWMYRLLYKYRKQLPNTYAKHKDNPLCTKKEKQFLYK